jgi:hypothetical protein
MSATQAVELVFETVPQSMLVTYVGVVYGELDPGSQHFDWIFLLKVIASLLSAGVAGFAIEVAAREWVAQHTDDSSSSSSSSSHASLFGIASRYGACTALLRGAQLGALIFWLALMGCALRQWA